MFTQTWKKYLPVIFILIKRSAQGEQTLKMNHTDFERASGGRKTKYSFSKLELIEARLLSSQAKHSPFAKEFAAILQEDPAVRKYILDQHLEFAMTNDFTLTIKNHLLVKEAAEEETEAAVTADETPALAHAE